MANNDLSVKLNISDTSYKKSEKEVETKKL